MKFTKEQLLNHNDIMSHVFLESIGNHESELFNKVKDLDEVKIELFIEGDKVDVEKFFTLMEKYYDELVKENAKKLLKNANTNVIDELNYLLDEVTEKISYHTEQLDWNKPNPFLKEKES